MILGELILKDSETYTEVDGKMYPLDTCPQRNFFEKLDRNKRLASDPYYLLAKSTLDEADFEFWLETRKNLWTNFIVDTADFTPIATMNLEGKFVVVDGAHRLALRSLRGHPSHRVALSLWAFGAM